MPKEEPAIYMNWLPKGLETAGCGLGPNGAPLLDVRRTLAAATREMVEGTIRMMLLVGLKVTM